MKRSISMRMRQFVTRSRGSTATSNSIIKSGRIARLTDARSIACTGRTGLHSLPLRRPYPPGAPDELAETVQTIGATTFYIEKLSS